MKKVIIFSIIAIFCISICINVSYAKDINLKQYIDNKIIIKYDDNEYWYEEYYWDYDKGGEYGYGKYDFSNRTRKDLSANYYWLHNLVDFVNAINDSNLSEKDISNSNDEDAILYAQRILNNSKELLPTFAYIGKEVEECKDSSNWTTVINSEAINTKRSIAAFQNITGYTKVMDYINCVDKALRKINAAYDIKRKASEYAVDINDDYNTKFRYTYKQIYIYLVCVYGDRYNVENSDIIKKVWDAKLGLYKNIYEGSEKEKYKKFENVLTKTNLYVDKEDSYKTKMSYDIDQIWLYMQIYNGDFGNVTDEEKGILAVEWQNMIDTGSHTAFYNKNAIHSQTSNNTSFNGQTKDTGYSEEQKQNAITQAKSIITNIIYEGGEYYKEHEDDFSNDSYSTIVEAEEKMRMEKR